MRTPSARKAPHVLIVADAIDSGIGSYLKICMNALDEHSWSYSAAYSTHRPSTQIDNVSTLKERTGGSLCDLRIGPQLNPLRDLRGLYRLVCFFVSTRPDILFSHSSKPGILCRILAKVFKVPHVHIPHAYYGFKDMNRGLLSKFFSLVERIFQGNEILIHNSIDEDLFAKTQIKLRNRSRVIPLTVSMPICSHENTQGALTGEVKICFFGRYEKQKQPFRFLDLAEKLQNVAGVSFIMSGFGSMERDLEARASRIKSFRFFTHQASETILSQAHVFVLPSLYEAGLPFVMLEAMSHGCYVLAARCPGLMHPPVLPEDVAFYDPTQEGDDVAKLEGLISKLRSAGTRSNQNRDYIGTNHSQKAFAGSLILTLKSALAKNEGHD